MRLPWRLLLVTVENSNWYADIPTKNRSLDGDQMGNELDTRSCLLIKERTLFRRRSRWT